MAKLPNIQVDERENLQQQVQRFTTSPWTIVVLIFIEIAIGLWGELAPNDLREQIEEWTGGYYTFVWVAFGTFLILAFILLSIERKREKAKPSQMGLSDKLRAQFTSGSQWVYNNQINSNEKDINTL